MVSRDEALKDVKHSHKCRFDFKKVFRQNYDGVRFVNLYEDSLSNEEYFDALPSIRHDALENPRSDYSR